MKFFLSQLQPLDSTHFFAKKSVSTILDEAIVPLPLFAQQGVRKWRRFLVESESVSYTTNTRRMKYRRRLGDCKETYGNSAHFSPRACRTCCYKLWGSE